MRDFALYYGLSFMDAMYSTHTPRELYALISWLPDDSAFSASLQGGREHMGWSTDRQLSVFLLEQVQMNGFNFVKANTDKKAGKNLKPPTPIPFPGRKIPKPRNRSSFGPIVSALARGERPPKIE